MTESSYSPLDPDPEVLARLARQCASLAKRVAERDPDAIERGANVLLGTLLTLAG